MMSPFAGGNRKQIPEVTGHDENLHIRRIGDLPNCTASNSGVYLMPEVRNFPVVDSLVLPRTGYQITVSPTHGLNVKSLTALLEKLNCTEQEKFQLVWVVPADVEFECSSISNSTINGCVEQYVLKLPLQVPTPLIKIPSSSFLPS